jgi:hypothetical protein
MMGFLKAVLVGVAVFAALFYFKAKEKPARPGGVKTMLGIVYPKN